VTSKYRGVRWHYCNSKWEARIFNGSRQVSLGYFEDENEAAQAYDAQAVQMRGGSAVVNFPNPANGPAKMEQKPPMQPRRRANASKSIPPQPPTPPFLQKSRWSRSQLCSPVGSTLVPKP
jgi:hypothetical protein